MRQAQGQSYCSLPWCGKAFGSPYHSRVFDDSAGGKVRLTYPSLIDYHDIVPRSLGGDKNDLENQAPLCHDCHMSHHDAIPGMRLEFEPDGSVSREDGKRGVLDLRERVA